MRVDHPDILEFISCKENGTDLQNFNISVAVTEEFMKALEEGRDYDVVDPHTERAVGKLDARRVFDLITKMAWKTGDPGIIFIDRINEANPTPSLGAIESTNPCGEQPLLQYECCNLGSVNLSKMVRDGKIDWLRLEKSVHSAVHFLDNVIDASKYPLPAIAKMAHANRKIGLGVMGFSDMLIQLGLPYDSEEAVAIGGQVMEFINRESKKASQAIAEKRGSFPNFAQSTWPAKGFKALRNATTTTIAPTGTISIIANCSSGIEPLFAITFMREVLEGTQLLEVNPWFEKMAMRREFYSEELMRKIAEKGTVRGMPEVPKDVQALFVTAHDIAPEWHVRMQAAFQKNVDNAVSKTINFPHDAKVEAVANAYLLAHRLGCKGITIYRDGSKGRQVLYVGHKKKEPEREKPAGERNVVSAEYSGGCKTCEA